MTALEDRLRAEFSELADIMAATEASEQAILQPPGDRSEESTSLPQLSTPSDRSNRRWWIVAGVAATVLAVIALGAVVGGSDQPTTVATEPSTAEAPAEPSVAEVPAEPTVEAVTPPTFGTWSVLAEAPIDPRPSAVAAWTGSEAVFWAGFDKFAYTDGAAYDPETDTWRNIAVPGWGHPGLTSAFFDGELYALAKGQGTRFDPVNGTWADMAPVAGMFLAATVASEDAIWGLGPAAQNPVGQPDIAIARYEPDSDTWDYGPVFEGTAEQALIVEGLSRPPIGKSPVLWDGSEIVVWGGRDGGVAFDPSTETWRIIDPPEPPSGQVTDSIAAVTDAGLSVLADIETSDGSISSVAILEGDGWRWLEAAIPVEEFESATVVAVPGWLIIFSSDQSPIMVNVASGAWLTHDDGPLGGVKAPNTVWTGTQLIIWGGTPNDPTSPEGVAWTPPTA